MMNREQIVLLVVLVKSVMPDIWAAFNILLYKEIMFRLSFLCRPVNKKEINKM